MASLTSKSTGCCIVSEVDSITVTDEKGTFRELRVFQFRFGETVIEVSSLGASIVKLIVPNGDNWIVGYDSVVDMWKSKNPLYFSAIPGRVANRIRLGHLQINPNDEIRQLAINNPPNHLHGGNIGFSHRIWDAEMVEEDAVVRFTLLSEDGDEGYPGTIKVTAEYRLIETPKLNVVKLCLAMKATLFDNHSAVTASPVNLTQHTYFSLAGNVAPDGVLSHVLRINANAYTPVDDTSIPTRQVQSLDDDKVMDFRFHRNIRQALRDYAIHKCEKTSSDVEKDLQDRGTNIAQPYGFDHNYVVVPSHDPNAMKFVATLQHSEKHHRLSVCSTAPGVQLYTGNFLDGSIANRWQGLCLETQHFPDSILVDDERHPDFYRGKCPILTSQSPDYCQSVEYTIEWADPEMRLEPNVDDFYGTALAGDPNYTSVSEMWKGQGVTEHDSTEWYRRGAAYYEESCPPTIDGVLGGFASISDIELEGSLEFIHQLVQVRPEARTWLEKPFVGETCRACECGAGIGRVVKGLLLSSSSLLPGITHCDLVEPSESLLLAAPAYLGDPMASKCRFFRSGLQDWEPISNSYSLIWVQWVLMYLTDRDIVAFLQRCGQALVPGGFIVMKENICESSDITLDTDDASVTRSSRYWKYLIHCAGLRIVHEYPQRGLSKDLYPVSVLALEPQCGS